MNRSYIQTLIWGFCLWPLTVKAGEVSRPLIDLQSRLQGSTILSGALGYAPNRYVASAAIWRMWERQEIVASGCSSGNLNSRSKFNFGIGLRLTQLGDIAEAPFAGRASAIGQTLQIDNSQITALNLAIQARVRLFYLPNNKRRPVWLGFTMDLAGASLGPARQSTGVLSATGLASPVNSNLLLINKKDRGTLNSEFYVACSGFRNRKLAIYAGLAHVASGYSLDNKRFQRFVSFPFMSISYRLSRKYMLSGRPIYYQ
jgi:hypothetical protein